MHFASRDNLGGAPEAGHVVITTIKTRSPSAPLKVRGAGGVANVVRGSCPLAFADLSAAQLWQAGALAQAGRTCSPYDSSRRATSAGGRSLAGGGGMNPVLGSCPPPSRQFP